VGCQNCKIAAKMNTILDHRCTLGSTKQKLDIPELFEISSDSYSEAELICDKAGPAEASNKHDLQNLLMNMFFYS